MRLLTLLLLLTAMVSSKAQISISKSQDQSFKAISQADFDAFKNTKTIFVLPETYTISEYKSMLEDAWTITPFEVVYSNNLDLTQYNFNDTSFVMLVGQMDTYLDIYDKPTYSFITYLDVFMFDSRKKDKEMEYYTEMTDSRKVRYNITKKNKDYYARCFLQPDANLLEKLDKDNLNHIDLKNNPELNTFKLGFLKNYMQYVNTKFEQGESILITDNFIDANIVNLKDNVLYIPSHVLSMLDDNRDKAYSEIKNILFKNYNFNYDIMSDDDMNKLILKNELLYYLRYYNMNDDMYLQVINSKTGDIIYSVYDTSKRIKLKTKDIANISGAVNHIN